MVEQRILIISLEAMGAVLRSTCLLPPIKKKFPRGHITWVTLPNAKALLENNPYIDRIIAYQSEDVKLLEYLSFDVAFCVDKSLQAGALAEMVQAKEKYGFGLTKEGAIRPLNKGALYQYQVGLDDQLKFFDNQKPETEQITNSMELEWVRDSYVLELSALEKQSVATRRSRIIGEAKGIIGFNTGCSLLFPYKKLPLPKAIELISAWRSSFPDYAVALLGGREDTLRQQLMKQAFVNDQKVISTPTDEGLRSGILWMDTTDLVFSGCSLGMHIAIGLKKPTIAWFGVSCSQEVDLYDLGLKIMARVPCTPCWKKNCNEEIKCYNQVSVDEVIKGTAALLPRH